MAKTRSAGSGRSIALILSYIFDWIVIIIIAAIGAGFYRTTGNRRPFSVVDPDISFPYVAKEKISTGVLVVVSLIIPAILMVPICLIFVPGPSASRGVPKSLLWRRKLWELNTALMGLCLAVASAFFFTQGMKNLFGHPRPDLLARCKPNLANLAGNSVGGFGNSVPLWNELQSWTICTQTDKAILNDGFQSFPSGHSSFSFSGLTFFSLFLCAKFAINIPYLLPYSHTSRSAMSSAFPGVEAEGRNSQTAFRNQAAAPPLYLFAFPLLPFCVAIYISSTRYSDFRHHGFDILFGSLMGFGLAWAAFRLYHLPIRRSSGWAWGPRSSTRAFGVGVGVGGYVEDVDHTGMGMGNDVELGKMNAEPAHNRVSSGAEESRLFNVNNAVYPPPPR